MGHENETILHYNVNCSSFSALKYNFTNIIPEQIHTFLLYRYKFKESYVYWTVHHLDSWIKIDQLVVTCFIISLFTAQHVSNVSTSFFRNLRLIVDLFHVLYCSGSICVGVTVWFVWGGVVSFCGVVILCLLDHASSW